MKERGKHIHHSDVGKTDISVFKLINYNLLFFIPMLAALLVSFWLGSVTAGFFETSESVVARIFMFIFSFLIFFFIIPFIRKREKISGIRYSLLAFLVVGLGVTIPSALHGNFSLLFSISNYFAHYLLLTFIFAPEVLGIHSNIADWFAKGKQLFILLVYVLIVVLYVFGFGTFYYDIYDATPNTETFSMAVQDEASMGTFVYYSIVTFATVGYGEITPVSPAARVVASLEMMFGMIINVLFIAMLLVYISGSQSIMIKKEEAQIKKEEQIIKKDEDDIGEVKEDVGKLEKKEETVESILKRIKSL